MRQAFAEARSGRPGPVLVDLPARRARRRDRPRGDTCRCAAPRAPAPATRRSSRRPPTRSPAPSGRSCRGRGRDRLRRRGTSCASWPSGSPSRCSPASPAAASIPDDHPLSAGGLGAHRTRLSKRLLTEADVVLGLGCRFEEMETNWSPGAVPAPDATYIQVDIDPAEIGRSVPARIGDRRATSTAVLGQLLAALESRARGPWTTGRAPPHAWSSPRSSPRSRPRSSEARAAGISRCTRSLPIRAVRAAFPRETTVAIDVGCLAQHMAGATPYFKVFEPRSLIVPSSFYGMGFAAAALPAARLVHPDRPAVCFVGDGSFQMVMNVLPVAAEYRLGVTWCVLNDGALGSIRDIQQHRFERALPRRPSSSVQPDFAAIAQACGCHGERVEDPARRRGRGCACARGERAAACPACSTSPWPRARARHARALRLLPAGARRRPLARPGAPA